MLNIVQTLPNATHKYLSAQSTERCLCRLIQNNQSIFSSVFFSTDWRAANQLFLYVNSNHSDKWCKYGRNSGEHGGATNTN